MYDKLFDLNLQNEMTSFFYNELSKFGKIKEYEKGSIIDPTDADTIYIVSEGYLKQVICSSEGKERGLFRLGRGTIFGEMDYFDGSRTFVLTKALENSKVSEIKRHVLEMELEKNPRIYKYFTHSIIRKYRIVMMFLADETFNDSLGKLASLIIRIGVMQEGKFKNNILINRVYTHEELASVMGCTRSTVTNALNYLKKEKYIKYKNKRIIIKDITGLMKYTKIF